MSAFVQIITNLEEFPSNFFELHHIFWKETNRIEIVGVDVYTYSAIAWLRIALQSELQHFVSEQLTVPIVPRFKHEEDINVEYMCLLRVTNLIKGIHYELFVNLQTPKDREKYFELFRRAQNRLFELVQQEEFAKECPENYLCDEYYKDGFNHIFAFDMDSYCSPINILYYNLWKSGTRTRPEVDASKLLESVENNMDSMAAHFALKLCEKTYLSLIDATTYYRIYNRAYPYVNTNNAPRKSIILANLPFIADYLPKEFNEWKVGCWLPYMHFAILSKMGFSLTYDKFGADPVKRALDSKDLSFDTTTLDFVVGDKYAFSCSLQAYTFLSQNNPQKYPAL